LIKICPGDTENTVETLYEDGGRHAMGSVSETDSKAPMMIQTCDFAAGSSRRIRQEEGFEERKNRSFDTQFLAVAFNDVQEMPEIVAGRDPAFPSPLRS
jgi:hypothetical protein